MIDKNNNATILGEIEEFPSFSHEICGEKFYQTKVSVKRTSGVYDLIPVIFSERLSNPNELLVGSIVSITGRFSSHNRREETGKNHMELFVFCNNITIEDVLLVNDECNKVNIHGFICKLPIYRVTPLGRDICDACIAVNIPYGKPNYIPCICWGRNAKFVGNLPVGTELDIEGRIQSRIYKKKLSGAESVDRMAFEFSVQKINEVGGNQQ